MKMIKYLFTVPKDHRITEKAMMRVLFSTVCSILLSVSCLVSTTWGWYTASLTSENNVIKTGTWNEIEPPVSEAETTVPVEETTESTHTTEATESMEVTENTAVTDATEAEQSTETTEPEQTVETAETTEETTSQP